MKTKNLILLPVSAMVTMTSCNGTMKVDVFDFRMSVLQAVSSENYLKQPEQIKISGSIKLNGEEYKAKNLKISRNMESKDAKDWTLEEADFLSAYAVIVPSFSIATINSAKSENLVYYIKHGFRVKGKIDEDKIFVSWDENCNLTKLFYESKAETYKFKISYKY